MYSRNYLDSLGRVRVHQDRDELLMELMSAVGLARWLAVKPPLRASRDHLLRFHSEELVNLLVCKGVYACVCLRVRVCLCARVRECVCARVCVSPVLVCTRTLTHTKHKNAHMHAHTHANTRTHTLTHTGTGRP